MTLSIRQVFLLGFILAVIILVIFSIYLEYIGFGKEPLVPPILKSPRSIEEIMESGREMGRTGMGQFLNSTEEIVERMLPKIPI